MKLALRIVGSNPLWLAYWTVALPLWVLGALTIPLVAKMGKVKTRPSNAYRDKRGILAWEWEWYNWLFGNEEDGIDGAEWYRELHKDWTVYKRIVMWSAFRNPTNNMRFWPYVNPRIDSGRIKWYGNYDAQVSGLSTGKFAWSYTWQGVFSNLLLVFPFRGSIYRAWIGWKLRPSDSRGISEDDYRFPRCGFGTQLKRIGRVINLDSK